MIWQILGVLFLVVANGFFVAAEFALVTVRVSEVEAVDGVETRATRLAQTMLGQLDAYLSACQLGITLASLGLGWAGEPLVARMLEPAFVALGLPTDKIHFFAFPLAFLLITFLHLTVGEQAPKIGAIQMARQTTLLVGYPLTIFYKVFRPFIWFLNKSSNAMLEMVGLSGVSEHERDITEAEVRTVLMQSAAMGHLHAREHRILEGVLDLEEKIARRYMVPRQEIVFLDRRDPIEKQLRVAAESQHSRLPLCDGDLDGVVGVVHVKELFQVLKTSGEPDTLESVTRDVLFLPETIQLDRLLRNFQRVHSHLAILVDEYGGVSGMITLDNVLEEMVGPIQDEFDSETPAVVKASENQFDVEASCPLEDFREQCGVEVPETLRADSVGGMLTELLHRIPVVGATVQMGEHKITVLEADLRRVIRVRVDRSPSEDPGSDPKEAPPVA